MIARCRNVAVVLLVVALLPATSRAIITTNVVLSQTNPLATTGFDWDYVGGFNYGSYTSSAVAVSQYWLLTAAHVADDVGNTTIAIAGGTYNQVDEKYHPTADLALIKLNRPLPSYYEIYAGSYPSGSGRLTGLLVGYGTTGTVDNATNYTRTAGGARGIERWGYNKIDFEDADFAYAISPGTWTNSGFWMYFNTGDSLLEAGVGPGDSGGGVFVNDGGTWKLAGIMTTDATINSQDAVFAVNVQDYTAWIYQSIPEPTTGILLAGAVLAFGSIRRLRRRFR